MLTFLSGLPRSGSTLLSAILSQNPEVHAEGNSAVCQLMWDAQVSCETSAWEQLEANNRADTQDALIASIPAIYYRDVRAQHIVDKCRSWTLAPNMAMIRRYITDDPRVIVLTRPVDEIVDSFKRLYAANDLAITEEQLLASGSEPIMRSLSGVEYARSVNRGEFLFVEYADLVDDPAAVIDEIYGFMDWERFSHDFLNVVNQHPEDDSVYGLLGMHEIRERVGR